MWNWVEDSHTLSNENYELNGKGEVYIQANFVVPPFNEVSVHTIQNLNYSTCIPILWVVLMMKLMFITKHKAADKIIYIFKLKQKITWHCLNIYTMRSHIVQNQACSYDEHITNQIRVTNSLKSLKQKKVQFEN